MTTATTTNFDIIEADKENIIPIREGRSAASLARLFSTSLPDLKEIQSEEHERLIEDINNYEELDDPIEPFLKYISWIEENFPSQQSDIIVALDRTKEVFKDEAHYMNDPRYVKIWIKYIGLVPDKRTVFVYMASKGIGQQLALFYEEYAAYLEMTRSRRQADEVYEAGITANARPKARLERKYNEFLKRVESDPIRDNEDSHPAFPATRPALALKSGHDSLDSSVSVRPPLATSPSLSVFGSRDKLEVYNESNASDSSSALPSGGSLWDSIGTLSHRTKENQMPVQSFAGQTISTIPQKRPAKMMMYKESETQPNVPPSNYLKPGERTLIATSYLGTNLSEFCFDEILAKSRGLTERIYTRPIHTTTIVKLNRAGGLNMKDRTQTLTFHTKAATDEVYEMFNQPVGNSVTGHDTLSDEDVYGDYLDDGTDLDDE